MRMVAIHLLGVISLTASGMGLRLLNCAFKIAKMANKWSQLHFQSHNQWSWNRTWHFFTSDTLPRDGDEWFWCPKTSFEDQRIRLTCSDSQVRELWRHGETYLSLIIGLALSEVQNLYLLLRRVDLYSLKIMYAHMSKCVCVPMPLYLCGSQRKVLSADSSSASFLYHFESRYLTELGAGSFSLASSQQSGDLPDPIPPSAWLVNGCWDLNSGHHDCRTSALNGQTFSSHLSPEVTVLTHQCKIWFLPSSASSSQAIVPSSHSVAVAAAIISEPPEHARASELFSPPPLSVPTSLWLFLSVPLYLSVPHFSFSLCPFLHSYLLLFFSLPFKTLTLHSWGSQVSWKVL